MHARRVMMNARTGATQTAKRIAHVIALRLPPNVFARMSLPPAIQNIAYQVMPATPKDVRVGALRGRSSRWCSDLSPVIQASMNG